MPAEDFVQIWEEAKDMGVLLGKGGLYGTVSNLHLERNSKARLPLH